MKIIKKCLLLLFPIFLILLLFILFLGGGLEDQKVEQTNNLNPEVERYRPFVEELAASENMQEYVDLILAIMQVESGGKGNDPMQSSEGAYNEKYPKVPNGIQDPYYSILCGIRELKNCLSRANVKNPEDENNIRVALAGYNFGNGYIEWCLKNYSGIWTLANAQEFSDMMKNKLGWSAYGDPEYANKVMSYYKTLEFITGAGDFIPPLKDYVITSHYGSRPTIGDYHLGTDLDGGYGASIYSPSDAVVYKASSSCPSNGGYLGNMCPGGLYSGAGNFVQLKTQYKDQIIYILLCHMKDVKVMNGQKILKGQLIGTQGHSGNSTGSHVHLEIHYSTSAVGIFENSIDPSKLIQFQKEVER